MKNASFFIRLSWFTPNEEEIALTTVPLHERSNYAWNDNGDATCALSFAYPPIGWTLPSHLIAILIVKPKEGEGFSSFLVNNGEIVIGKGYLSSSSFNTTSDALDVSYLSLQLMDSSYCLLSKERQNQIQKENWKISISFQRIAKKLTNESVSNGKKVSIEGEIKESTIYNNRWYGECCPSSLLSTSSSSPSLSSFCEEVMIITSPQYLELQILPSSSASFFAAAAGGGSTAAGGGESKASSSVASSNLLHKKASFSPLSSPSSSGNEFLLEVYENQFRSSSSQDWISSSSTLHHASHYSNYDGSRIYSFPLLEYAFPPKNCQWKDDSHWQVAPLTGKDDRNGSQDDGDTVAVVDGGDDDVGWLYGASMNSLLSSSDSVSETSSVCSSTGFPPKYALVRRRKWIRILRINNGEKLDRFQILDSFGIRPSSSSSLFSPYDRGGRSSSISDDGEDGSSAGEGEGEYDNDRATNITSVCSSLKSPSSIQHYLPSVASSVPFLPKQHFLASSAIRERMTDFEFHHRLAFKWHQVLSSTVISPSILAVSFYLHRITNTSSTTGMEGEKEEKTEMILFISNCYAIELSRLIQERKKFAEYRAMMMKLGNKSSFFISKANNHGASKQAITKSQKQRENLSRIIDNSTHLRRTLDDEIEHIEKILKTLVSSSSPSASSTSTTASTSASSVSGSSVAVSVGLKAAPTTTATTIAFLQTSLIRLTLYHFMLFDVENQTKLLISNTSVASFSSASIARMSLTNSSDNGSSAGADSGKNGGGGGGRGFDEILDEFFETFKLTISPSQPSLSSLENIFLMYLSKAKEQLTNIILCYESIDNRYHLTPNQVNEINRRNGKILEMLEMIANGFLCEIVSLFLPFLSNHDKMTSLMNVDQMISCLKLLIDYDNSLHYEIDRLLSINDLSVFPDLKLSSCRLIDYQKVFTDFILSHLLEMNHKIYEKWNSHLQMNSDQLASLFLSPSSSSSSSSSSFSVSSFSPSSSSSSAVTTDTGDSSLSLSSLKLVGLEDGKGREDAKKHNGRERESERERAEERKPGFLYAMINHVKDSFLHIISSFQNMNCKSEESLRYLSDLIATLELSYSSVIMKILHQYLSKLLSIKDIKEEMNWLLLILNDVSSLLVAPCSASSTSSTTAFSSSLNYDTSSTSERKKKGEEWQWILPSSSSLSSGRYQESIAEIRYLAVHIQMIGLEMLTSFCFSQSLLKKDLSWKNMTIESYFKQWKVAAEKGNSFLFDFFFASSSVKGILSSLQSFSSEYRLSIFLSSSAQQEFHYLITQKCFLFFYYSLYLLYLSNDNYSESSPLILSLKEDGNQMIILMEELLMVESNEENNFSGKKNDNSHSLKKMTLLSLKVMKAIHYLMTISWKSFENEKKIEETIEDVMSIHSKLSTNVSFSQSSHQLSSAIRDLLEYSLAIRGDVRFKGKIIPRRIDESKPFDLFGSLDSSSGVLGTITNGFNGERKFSSEAGGPSHPITPARRPSMFSSMLGSGNRAQSTTTMTTPSSGGSALGIIVGSPAVINFDENEIKIIEFIETKLMNYHLPKSPSSSSAATHRFNEDDLITLRYSSLVHFFSSKGTLTETLSDIEYQLYSSFEAEREGYYKTEVRSLPATSVPPANTSTASAVVSPTAASLARSPLPVVSPTHHHAADVHNLITIQDLKIYNLLYFQLEVLGFGTPFSSPLKPFLKIKCEYFHSQFFHRILLEKVTTVQQGESIINDKQFFFNPYEKFEFPISYKTCDLMNITLELWYLMGSNEKEEKIGEVSFPCVTYAKRFIRKNHFSSLIFREGYHDLDKAIKAAKEEKRPLTQLAFTVSSIYQG
jgi:hypothetical protein